MLATERLRAQSKLDRRSDTPTTYEEWLATIFPHFTKYPLGIRHHELWQWSWNIQPGTHIQPFIAIWPRGSGKSTTSELVTVSLGAEKRKKYCWYICETQAQADQHVDSIAAMIENPFISYYYPKFAERRVGKYGNVKAWRRNRLRCGNGFTVDGMGLDSAKRGSKVEEQRPDFIVIDDADGKHDSVVQTEKKIATITTSILPAGAWDLTVLGVQNLIIPDGIFSRLANGKADFLNDRIVSGPYPAIEGLKAAQVDGKYKILEGTATWEGQSLETCQKQIGDWGYSAFLKEAQHEVEIAGGMFDHLTFRRCKPDEVPTLVRTVCWVDPAISATDGSACQAIQVDGLGEDGLVYRLFSYEAVNSPLDTLQKAILNAKKYKCETIGIETNQGGDTWISVFERAVQQLELKENEVPALVTEKASSGTGSKVERASKMLTDYENGSIVHVEGPSLALLESSLRRFPVAKPYDLVDVCYWSWVDIAESTTWLLN